MSTVDTDNYNNNQVQDACNQIITQLTQYDRDNIVLPVHESWPKGLSEALLAHYGKFACLSGDKELHINAKSLDREQRFNSVIKSMGIDPSDIPVIRLNG